MVLLDQLVTLAANDDEIYGVLAHELGHVHYHHGMRMLLQSSAVALLLTAWVGDVSTLLASLPAGLLQARYSRDFEAQADDYAAATLLANGIPPSRLADLLERMAAQRDSSGNKDTWQGQGRQQGRRRRSAEAICRRTRRRASASGACARPIACCHLHRDCRQAVKIARVTSEEQAAPPPIIAIAGPTAAGKSALALQLVERLRGRAEIVSVDSAQVYRGMDIGTAKPDAATRARVPHHLLDILDPAESYSAARFAADAAAPDR